MSTGLSACVVVMVLVSWLMDIVHRLIERWV
jgi:hypothetical protein